MKCVIHYGRILLLLTLICISLHIEARNAPVTHSATISSCPYAPISIPITVDNFISVSSISLRLDYNPLLMTFSNYSNVNSSLSGIIVNDVAVSIDQHKIMIVWSAVNPMTMTSGSKIMDLNFYFLNGPSSLSFNNNSNGGQDCEFADENGFPMNDNPTTNYYYDGLINSNGPAAAGVISGPQAVCQGANGITYSILPVQNATSYNWIVTNGIIVSGNNTTSVTINFANSANYASISVSGINDCGAGSVSSINVIAYPLPIPTISGNSQACKGSSALYTTEPGKIYYVWKVSPGGTIVSGGGSNDNTATIQWNIPGFQSLSVNYSNQNGCIALNSTFYPVSVNQLPIPTITGPANACLGSVATSYSTEPGMTNYLWSISPGGTIISGVNNNSVTVVWNMIGSQFIAVNYTNANGCSAASNSIYPVTVYPIPKPTISGPNTALCSDPNNIYTTQPGMSNYHWFVPSGGTITEGGTLSDNYVKITWNTPGSQFVGVNYSNSFGCPANNPFIYNIDVAPSKSLNLILYLEGLFNGAAMNKAQNGSGDQFNGTIADQITIELHSSEAPYSLVDLPHVVNININGICLTWFPATLEESYYIVLKHRNSIETWSSIPILFNDETMSYNFSISANQAFGNNLKFINSKYCIFAGDVNQDGIIDLDDLIQIDNSAANLISGYISSDVNGDGFVNMDDIIITDNNSTNFIKVIHP